MPEAAGYVASIREMDREAAVAPPDVPVEVRRGRFSAHLAMKTGSSNIELP